MPLYDETTNLQSQGRFAPGVNYRAAIKSPHQPSPSLEKAREVFNIDLSRIGDAMINAQDNEYKLQASIIGMEQDMREAEKERQFKIDLAEKEDQRLREFKQADLEVEWYKAQTERAKTSKEDFTAAAQRSFLEDPEVNQAFIDYNNGNITNAEMSRKVQAAALRASGQYPGVPLGKLLSVASSLGWTTNLGGQIETNDEIRDKQQKDQITADTAIGRTLDPSSTEADAAVIGANYREKMQRIRRFNEIMNNPNSERLSKEMAQRLLQNDLDSVIGLTIHNYMKTTAENLRKVDNPFEYVESMKQMITMDISTRTGSKEYDVRRSVDAAFKMYGIDSTLQGILGDAKTDAEYKKNALDAYYNNYKLGMYTTYPMVMAYVAFGDLMQHMNIDEKEAASGALARMIFGGYSPGTAEKDWTVRYGYPYNQSVQYSEQELEVLRDKLGLTNTSQAAMYLAMRGVKETPQSLGSGRITDENAINFTKNATSMFTGNPNKNGSMYGLPVEDQAQILKNVQECVDSGYCDSEALRAIVNNIVDERYREAGMQVANLWSANYKLSKSFRDGNESKDFFQKVNYMIPDEFEYLNLKNSVMWYAYGEDGDIYIDYTENGWLKTGLTERGKRADSVRDTMNRAGLTIPEKLAFYNTVYPNLTENTDPDKDKQWLRRIPVMAQEATLSAGAQFDTWAASKLADLSKTTDIRSSATGMAKQNEAKVSEQTDSSETKMSPEAETAFNKLVAPEQTETKPLEISIGGDDTGETPGTIYIDQATDEEIVTTPTLGWTEDKYDDEEYSYKYVGDRLFIDYGDYLIDANTSKSPKEILDDFNNIESNEISKYARIYLKKGSD